MTVIADTGVRNRTIVVGIVEDRWSGALAYALQISLTEAAKVSIVRVSTTPPAARDRLTLPLQVRDIEGDPTAVLLREAGNADLMVVETGADEKDAPGGPDLSELHRRGDTLLIEVDFDGEIVRASGATGWTYSVQPDLAFAMPAAPPRHPRTICVGVDGSPSSTSAVAWAVAMATTTGSPLMLVSVHGVDPTSSQRSRADAQDNLSAAARLVPGQRPASVISCGEPAEGLIEASRGASMLVLGRHGTRGLIHSALGSVGETCARLAECPVVIVPHP